MAIIRPSIDHLDELQQPLGEAERAVFDAFAGLGDDWTIYVRPKVGQDVPDLVLVHDFGAHSPLTSSTGVRPTIVVRNAVTSRS